MLLRSLVGTLLTRLRILTPTLSTLDATLRRINPLLGPPSFSQVCNGSDPSECKQRQDEASKYLGEMQKISRQRSDPIVLPREPPAGRLEGSADFAEAQRIRSELLNRSAGTPDTPGTEEEDFLDKNRVLAEVGKLQRRPAESGVSSVDPDGRNDGRTEGL